MTKTQVLDKIESAVRSAGSAQALAQEWGVSASYLSDIRLGKREPGPTILAKMGLSATVHYTTDGRVA